MSRRAQARRGGDHTKWSRKLSYFAQGPPHMAEISSEPRLTKVRNLTEQFDLFHVRSNNAWQNIFTQGTAINEGAMASELAAFEAVDWQGMKFILQIQSNHSAYAAYNNDSHWNNMVANVAKIGRVYRDSDLITGIYWDWEYYGGSGYWHNDTSASGLSGTYAEKRDLVITRFKQLMNGLIAEWPDVLLTVSHGASGNTVVHSYIGEVDPLTGIDWTISHNDVQWANDLRGAAAIGIQDAVWDAGRVATFLDGGQLYGARTQADFDRCRKMQQVVHKQNRNPGSGTYDAGLFDSGRADRYHLGANIGIYDRCDYPGGCTGGIGYFGLLQPEVIRDCIANGMKRTGSLTWLYTETHDWCGVGGKTAVPQSYLDAVAEGRRLGRL